MVGNTHCARTAKAQNLRAMILYNFSLLVRDLFTFSLSQNLQISNNLKFKLMYDDYKNYVDALSPENIICLCFQCLILIMIIVTSLDVPVAYTCETRVSGLLVSPTYLENVPIQLLILVFDSLTFADHIFMFVDEPHFAIAHDFDFICQTQNLVEFAFSAILRCHFVLSPATYVANETQLRLAQVVLRQSLVELVHRQIYNVVNRNRHI